MLTSSPVPVLSIAADAVKDLQGHDALIGLWTLFTKCKDSLQEGHRLENISWRLWYCELAQAQARIRGQRGQTSSNSTTCPRAYQLLTPASVIPNDLEDSGPSSPARLAGSTINPDSDMRAPTHAFPSTCPFVASMAVDTTMVTTSASTGIEMDPASTIPARSMKSHCVGRIVVEVLPNHLRIKPYLSAKSSLMPYPQPPPPPALSYSSRTPYEQLMTPTPTSFATAIDDGARPDTAAGNMTANAFRRPIVVDQTPHPTPTTPTLGGSAAPLNVSFDSTINDNAGKMQISEPTYLLTPLPLAVDVVSHDSPVRPQDNDLVSELSQLSVPESNNLIPVPTLVKTMVEYANFPDGMHARIGMSHSPNESWTFFLQHLPDDISIEGDDGCGRQQANYLDASLPASGGELVHQGRCNTRDLERIVTPGTRRSQLSRNCQARTMKTGAEAKAKEHISAVAECREGDNNVDEDEHDKCPASTVTNNTPGRWRKGRVGTMACGKRVVRLTKYHAGLQGHGRVVPMMQKRSVGQVREHHTPQHHLEQQQHKALCNAGSGSTHRSEAAQSTNAPMCVPVAGGPAKDQAPMPMKDSTPDVPIRLSSAVSVELITKAPNSQNGYTPQNNVIGRHGKSSAPISECTNTMNNRPEGTQQEQCRRTIAVITSEGHEMTDKSDSEWASEDMEAGEKNSGTQKPEQQCHDGNLGNGSCHGKSAGMISKAADEAWVCTAFEVQRQPEFFMKVPKQSYSNVNRTRPSSLTQLLNPNPALCSSGRLHETTRPSQNIVTMNLTTTQADVQVHGRPFRTVPPQKRYDAFAAPPTCLSSNKNTVALAMATQVTVISRSKISRNEKSSQGYRPKSPAQEETEDGSEEENEDQCQVSKSIALEKLQAFMLQQAFSKKWQQQWKLEDGGNDGTKVHENDHPDGTVTHTSGVQATTTNTAAMVAWMQIPPGHPYNLPPPAPPTTPCTTRRRMLSTELSESMRRQLLWERQVSNTTNPTKALRRETGHDEF